MPLKSLKLFVLTTFILIVVFFNFLFIKQALATPLYITNSESLSTYSFIAGSITTLTGTVTIEGTQVSDPGDNGCGPGNYLDPAWLASAGWKLKSGTSVINTGSASQTIIQQGVTVCDREPWNYLPEVNRIDFSINVSGLAVGSYSVNITGDETAMKGWQESFEIDPGLNFTVTSPSPTCSYAAPDGDTTAATTGTRQTYAYGVANAPYVYFAAWSEVNGQDDLIWYAGTNAGGGTWYADIDLSSHPGLGTIYVHTYMFDAAWNPFYCDAANFTRCAITCSADTDCQICNNPGTCSSYYSNKANGTACTSDGNSCTSDVCSSGTCVHNNVPVNGVCGSANGSSFYTAPSTNLCSAGTAGTVSGSGPWTWPCNGICSGTNASCSANLKQDGVCGPAAKTYLVTETAFSGAFCSIGSASPSSPSFPAPGGSSTWTCLGVNGGNSSTTCTASRNCTANYGQTCTSSPNNCGNTNPGTYSCTGVCSAVPPPDGIIACSSDAACNDGSACTTDTCSNPGTCSAYCSNTGVCPTVSSMTAPNWSYIQAGQSGAPKAYLDWVFSDSDIGSSESAYQIIVSDQNNINSPLFDSDVCTAYQTPSNKCQVDAGVGHFPLHSALSVIAQPLEYNQAYYWWIKVWDNIGAESNRTQYNTNPDTPIEANDGFNNKTFTTYKHEMPDVGFNWLPTSPSKGEKVKFTDTSQIYTSAAPTTAVACNSSNCAWLWTAPSGATIDDTATSTPTITFNTVGSESVKLRVTDNDGYYTETTMVVNVKAKLPKWQEVKPQ